VNDVPEIVVDIILNSSNVVLVYVSTAVF